MTKLRFLSFLSFIFLISLLINSCGSCSGRKKNDNNPTSGTISISGAFALYPMAVKWAEEYMKLYPGVRIDVSAGGAGKGITDVLSNMVEIGLVSRAINPEEKAKGAFEIAVTRDAVLATINAKNPYCSQLLSKGLTKEKFKQAFLTQKQITWSELLGVSASGKVTVYTRSDACGAAEMWAKYLDTEQESLSGIGVFGDPGIADAVKSDVLGLGYNNLIYVYDIKSRNKYSGIEVVPIDLNADGSIDQEEDFYNSLPALLKAIKDGRYPSPPARDLYFVMKNKPDDQVLLAFLEWVLTEGQQYLEESGYIALSKEQIDREMMKIK